MKKHKLVFFKEDLLSKGVFILYLAAILVGGVIIFYDKIDGNRFGAEVVIAAFSFITDILILYFSIICFGKDFQYRTINMIRLSPLSGIEVLLRRFIEAILLSLILVSSLLLELSVYKAIVLPQFDIWQVASVLVPKYLIYSAFLFLLGTLTTVYFKNILGSFLIVYFGITVLSYVTSFLSRFGDWLEKLLIYTPFYFVRSTFLYQSSYSHKQYLILLCWILVMVVVFPKAYKRFAFV